MSAFLKLDRCADCGSEVSWEWVPPIELQGKSLAGTGVWRSTLVAGLCSTCHGKVEKEHNRKFVEALRLERVTRALGVMPATQFTFERFRVSVGNRSAFERAQTFIQNSQNMYLWGPTGSGKSHLAVAIARSACWHGSAVARITPSQLIRGIRMRTPEEEQHVLDTLIRADVLILDGLSGDESVFARSAIQEVIDGREYANRTGLIVTSRVPLRELARRMADNAIPMRLERLCAVCEIRPAGRGPEQKVAR